MKENYEENFEDLLIERRKHFCNLEEKINININNHNNELINKEEVEDKSINIFEKDNKVIDIFNSYDDINNDEINKITRDVTKDSEKDLIFIKEKEDKIKFED